MGLKCSHKTPVIFDMLGRLCQLSQVKYFKKRDDLWRKILHATVRFLDIAEPLMRTSQKNDDLTNLPDKPSFYPS